ncbi:potassium-transporting ATPase subunit KdpC [Roseomonas aeriglobus]|nr:potassium-transporting ATPase subunit KdpC [Roseomonas aeriglobus]
MTTALRPALVMTGLFAGLLGVAYPLAMTVMGQTIFPHQANGSLIRDGGEVVGSELIGQRVTADRYFRPRPSAAGKGYDGLASAGSNLGPSSQALADRLRADIARQTPSASGRIIPPDLVTASASGLDPHISPEAALYQVDRVARARGLTAASVRAAVERATEHPLLGILGEPRVNVLLLNRALDGRPAGR